jgi:ribonucleoside-diphosphate reductase beta chain
MQEDAHYKIMETVLNKKSTDISKQPMFLGETLGLQRYDIVKYPEFKKSYEDQRSQYWQANEIPIAHDRSQYETLSESEKFIFVNNLMFQTMGDSCLSRTIDHLKSHVTNSELEFAMNWWLLMENTHSESYTWILQNIVKDPSQFFEDIYDNTEVMNRAKQLTNEFDSLLKSESDDPKEEIFRTVLSLQIAEGILFYISFACSYWFGSRGIMKGNADIIKLINKDEDLHVAITQNIMKRWRNDPSEGFQEILKQNENLVYDAYKKAVKHEKDWATYLFSKGPLLGLNEEILHGYVEWLANIRLRSMGYNQIFETKKNPIGGWIKEYINSDETDPAPQEKPIGEYEKSKIVNDIDNMNFDF